MSEPKIINPEIVELYHNQLKSNRVKLNYLRNSRGLNNKIIEKYLIGYDPKSDRFTIPIKDAIENYVNVRKWKRTTPKMISYDEGYGETRLYPIENLQKSSTNKIIFCEGEWDCLLLIQNGFNAITKTGGVQSWDDRWNSFFKNKDVIFIYDCDKAGRDAAETHKNFIMKYASSIKIIDLGLGNKEDISDWFMKHKKSSQELATLVRKSKVKDIYEYIDLATSLESKHYNKRIKFNGIVVGKDLSPYLLPHHVKITCKTGTRGDNKICKICPLNDGYLNRQFVYETDRELLVKMVNANDLQVKGYIRQYMNIPAGRTCPGSYEIEIDKRQNLEEIAIIPEIDHERINQEYVVRKCYYFGMNIPLNQAHLFKGTTWADPNTQVGVHLITEAKTAKDNISKFQLSDEIKKKLKIFQPDKPNDVESIRKKLKDIYTDFTYNVTKMYERQNLIEAIDLVYHSVLSFSFLGRKIKKGWLECAIMGDTKCGKSETALNLVKHFRAGEFVSSGENTTRAGLLGGEQQTHRGSWNVTWGKLVLNDKGIVILDESDELKKKGIIGQLSGVRSSGVAELIQIQQQRASARTRIIWISNPLWGRMSEHNYGVDVVREIFETQQDISRIDFAVGAAGEDVSDELINKKHSESYRHKYTTHHCHYSVMFAWSRLDNQIVFDKDAEDFILKLATKFGKIYSPEIPLVIGAEMRVKLARMAVSLAARLYSTDSTGEKIRVMKAHVEVVADFLARNYPCVRLQGFLRLQEERKYNRRCQQD
jgi:5S rRNA maturation endonuclease (ribonuclease M5)